MTLNERKIPVKWGYLTEKIEIQKNEKTPRGIYLRKACAKFQNRMIIYERDTLPQSLRTHTLTHKHTHFHCQILAQLKLRKSSKKGALEAKIF